MPKIQQVLSVEEVIQFDCPGRTFRAEFLRVEPLRELSVGEFHRVSYEVRIYELKQPGLAIGSDPVWQPVKLAKPMTGAHLHELRPLVQAHIEKL